MKVYLDNAATTMVDSKVVSKMMPYFSEKYGNASSVHSKGQEAKMALDDSRKVIAKFLGCKFDEVVFTASGTESNNMVLRGIKGITNKKEIITTNIEHPAILETCADLAKSEGYKIKFLKVDNKGFIDLKELEKMISNETALVSVMHGNNEIGVLNDISKIGEICHKHNVLFHTDAVQSLCKANIDLKNIDFLSASAHKVHGPKGVGLFYLRKGLKLKPLITGGGHEHGLRSGTYNVAGIVGFAEAVKLFSGSEIKNMTRLRDKLIDNILKIKGTRLNGASGEKRLCNNVNVSFEGAEGEAIGAYLDSNGICISTGSACSSHSLKPSHVLEAIGLKHEEMNGSVRMSLSKFTTDEEIDYVLNVLAGVIEKLRKISGWKG